MTNNNKQTVDLPFFELCNQAPVATSALSALATSEDGTDRYIYYLTSSSFYKYDTVADTWIQLANPVVAPVTVLSMRYTSNRGSHGRVLGATSTTITIPGLRGKVLDGKTLRITQGTGVGQERTLTYVGETIHDSGVVTAVVASNVGITDNLKKWTTNQWRGYTLGITFSTGVTQYKKILYNDATTLYVYDPNLLPHEPWNNYPYVATAPYAVPVAATSHYKIISSTFSVSSWDVTPDYTSYFTTLTGGLYLVSSSGSAPFFTLQYYDVVNDMWQQKTVPQSLIGAALGTDVSIERTSRVGTALTTNVGVTTALSSRTFQDLGQNLTNDRYANHRIRITGGTGLGQTRRIVGHTTDTYTVSRSWDINPDNTSTYQIWPDYDRLYMAGNGSSAMFAYSPMNDYWMQAQTFDDGITSNISVVYENASEKWTPFGVTSGTVIANGVRAVNPTPTAGGTGYAIGDVAVCNVGGTGAQVRVTSIAPGGIVTGIELAHTGTATGFTVGTGRATTQTGGLGTGSGLTIEITEVGETTLVTTATAHYFERTNVVRFAGCTNAGWNTTYTIIGVPFTAAVAPTTFCIASNVGVNMAATSSQTTTIIVDPSKNWITNEHVGRVVQLHVGGINPTTQFRWITANTATTLTVATITAAVNGTSKYVIYDSKIFGIDDQRKETRMSGYGYATSGTTSSLTDSTKNWVPNQWANYFFKVETGTGYGSGRIQITSNTATTLNFATQTFTPDTTTKYEIADCWGLMTAGATTTITETTTKNWATNQWAQKRVRVVAGTAAGQETTISSNTATALTVGSITAPDATSVYAILANMTRGAGIELIHNNASTNLSIKGRYLYIPRGGGTNGWDIYDLTTGKWITPDFTSPQSELFTTGSSYAYDGNFIYAARSTTGTVVRVFKYDINKNTFDGLMTTTTLQGTAHVGNLMEIVKDPTGDYEYLYLLQNTGTLLQRALIF